MGLTQKYARLRIKGPCLGLILFFLMAFITAAGADPVGMSDAGDAADADAPFTLSDSEYAWLASKKEIRVGMMDAWPPLDFVEDGRLRGIGVDYVEVLNNRLLGHLKLVPGRFDDNLRKIESGELDALLDVTPKPERDRFLSFTNPYLTIPHSIITRRDAPKPASEKDLSGKTVALERGFYNVTYFRENFPEVGIKEFENTSAALDAVSRGAVDAYVGNRAVAMYIIERELLANLTAQGRTAKPPVVLTIGVRKDWPLLVDLLNRALAAIPREETSRIHSKWLEFARREHDKISLSTSESAWLDAHRVIRVGYDVDWLPVEGIDESGRYVGLAADYLDRISSRLGVRFQMISPRPWNAMLEAVKRGDATMISAATKTEERSRFLDFTKPYLSLPMVIVTREDTTYIDDMRHLNGKRVGVISGYASQAFLARYHPRISLVPVKEMREGLLSVVDGETFAFVGNLASISQVIGREGLSTLKVSGETPYRYNLGIGVAKGNPYLLSALQKALDTITEDEISQIHRKWFTVTYAHETDYTLLFEILGLATAALGFVLFWNRRLSREVARRIQTESQLNEAKQRAESADQLKSAFLATMSHELRTPLNSIIGFTGVLLQHLAGPLNEEQTKQLNIIKNAGQHLLDLINDVLDISKIEAGQLRLCFETFDIADVVDKCVEALSPLAEKKHLELKVVSETVPIAIQSDRRRVEQVLINLMNNAVKFTETGGVTIRYSASEASVNVSVEDTGIGIKVEDLPKLFKAFTQVDTGLSRQHEGTGLGLSISKKLVDMLGGEITVISDWGKGSLFSFTLPLAKEIGDG